jgi:hypothetical protein
MCFAKANGIDGIEEELMWWYREQMSIEEQMRLAMRDRYGPKPYLGP